MFIIRMLRNSYPTPSKIENNQESTVKYIKNSKENNCFITITNKIWISWVLIC